MRGDMACPRLPFAVAFLAPVFLVFLALAGCSDERPPDEVERHGDRPVEATGVALEEGEEIGGRVADAVLQEIVGALRGALQEKGTAGALDFCADEAIALTRSIEERFRDEEGRDVAIKRTTDRRRNPDNAPDELEREVLEYYLELTEADEPIPSSFVQDAGDHVVRYYRPLRTSGICLQCHGDRTAMEPEVVEVLEKRYPDDRAVGYEVGEFRGLLRVQVPLEPR